MSKQFEISLQGNLLCYDALYRGKEVQDIITKNNLEGLVLYQDLPMIEDISNLNFLSEFIFLKCLHIYRYKCLRYDFLKHLFQLTGLSINTFDKNEVDVSALANLRNFTIQWRPESKGFEFCNKLEILTLIDFEFEKDLKKISKAVSVKKLFIKGSSIASLSGIEELMYVEELLLANCKKLNSLSQLSGLKALHTLTLDSTSKDLNFDDLGYLPNVQNFFVVNCKNPPSSDWVKERMPNVVDYRGDQ